MHYNNDSLVHFAETAGDHEGRLTHKSPPRTLYDSAYKERWFKLRANLLFYYRLNEFGGVEKNEPSGVFVLENVEIQMEHTDLPFGFAIRWKDDLERKHLFFASSEASAVTWMNKLINASYEHLRAQMVMLRVQIRRKTGKDPLEHLGTPLMQRTSWADAPRKSRFHVDLEEDQLSQELPKEYALQSSSLTDHQRPDRLSPSRYSLAVKSPYLKVKVEKSPSLREPLRAAPVPPPRKGKKHTGENGHVVVDNLVPGLECKIVDDLVPGVGGSRASFRCHIDDECLPKKKDNLLD
uniref:Pleckstrin homology domain-containing family J member 1 n=1 Tax=Scylla olivacea TaxID=85551 RepID=A0A0P4W4N6_SCYOL